jgi:phenylacetate-CoA ligase
MLKEIIKSAPDFIEKPARYIYMSIPEYIRFGKNYRKQYKFLKRSQWWTREQHEEYQKQQINKLLTHAYKNVPYYTKVFDEMGIKPEDIKSFGDIKRLPYLTKDIVRNNLKDLVARNYNPKRLEYVTSGGTTGMPMGFYIDSVLEKAVERAFISSLWDRAGYNTKKINRSIVIRGNLPKNGVYEYKGRDLILSSFRLTEENIRLYIGLIEKFNPDFIYAYPSSLHLLSKYILCNNIKLNLHKLKCILCSSENLYDYQRPDIEKAFSVKVYSHYGHSEQACLAGECEESSYLHIQSEYGYTEIINEYGQDVSCEDEVGEIVATGFNNYAVPFIRYKTGDLVVNSNAKCKCGRNYKIIKGVEGRKQEFLIDSSGGLATFTSSHYVLSNVKEKITSYQYIQGLPGKVMLHIQCNKQIIPEDMNKMRETFNLRYPGFELEIEIVDNIERTKNGKFKFLVQNVDIDRLYGLED